MNEDARREYVKAVAAVQGIETRMIPYTIERPPPPPSPSPPLPLSSGYYSDAAPGATVVSNIHLAAPIPVQILPQPAPPLTERIKTFVKRLLTIGLGVGIFCFGLMWILPKVQETGGGAGGTCMYNTPLSGRPCSMMRRNCHWHHDQTTHHHHLHH
jgi:hypothetical protein